LLRDMGRTDEALAEYGRLIPALEASWRMEERNSFFKTLLCGAYSGRAITFLLESQFGEALADAKRALATDSGSVPQFFEFQIAFIRARMASGTADFRAPYAGAVAVADRLLRTGVFPGGHLYTFAGIYSRAAAAAAKDEAIPAAERSARAERYAALAVHLLAKAHAAGFFVPAGRVEQLRTNAEFDLLRGRSDFQKLLANVLEKRGST
ncbi:MAG TPA: hypothetical protein VKU02_25555, partial [Gemmataceae bacterium]|nr:hypothetical protein [Gemmataceae bacterium]